MRLAGPRLEVRACSVLKSFALSTLREVASPDSQEQEPEYNCGHNDDGLRHTCHTSTGFSAPPPNPKNPAINAITEETKAW